MALARTAAGPQTLPGDSPRSGSANAAGSSRRRAKPRGTRSYRIAEEVTEVRRRSGCSTQAGRNRFFLPAGPADDPRPPFSTRFQANSPNSGGPGGIVLDSGGTVRAGRLSPFRWLDTSAGPSAATTGGPPPCTRGCNRTFARNTAEKDDRTPCTGNAASAARRRGIETPAQMMQTE